MYLRKTNGQNYTDGSATRNDRVTHAHVHKRAQALLQTGHVAYIEINTQVSVRYNNN